jgi:hypothetical protein
VPSKSSSSFTVSLAFLSAALSVGCSCPVALCRPWCRQGSSARVQRCASESLWTPQSYVQFMCLCVCAFFLGWVHNFTEILIKVHDPPRDINGELKPVWSRVSAAQKGSILTGSFSGSPCDVKNNAEINCACPGNKVYPVWLNWLKHWQTNKACPA